MRALVGGPWPGQQSGGDSADCAPERTQLDLFLDTQDTVLVNRIVANLLEGNPDSAEEAVAQLRAENPEHPDLPMFVRLLKALRTGPPDPGSLTGLRALIESRSPTPTRHCGRYASCAPCCRSRARGIAPNWSGSDGCCGRSAPRSSVSTGRSSSKRGRFPDRPAATIPGRCLADGATSRRGERRPAGKGTWCPLQRSRPAIDSGAGAGYGGARAAAPERRQHGRASGSPRHGRGGRSWQEQRSARGGTS